MAIQHSNAHKSSYPIRKTAFKYVSLTLIIPTVLFSVYLISQGPIHGSEVYRRKAVRIFSSWLQTHHEQHTNLGKLSTLAAAQDIGVLQHRATCSQSHPLAKTKGESLRRLVTRSLDLESSDTGYSQPSFPFNILPGRVESSCRDYTGYALERCKTDVRTRTQLFIALAAVFSFVVLSVVLMTILTCIRRVKARSRVGRSLLTGKNSRQAGGTFTPGGQKKNKQPRRGNIAEQSLDREDAVEAEEQGIADRDIPVTLDGMTDGWMQWIRQRANMEQLPGNPTPKKPAKNMTPNSSAPALRIPPLKLPKPILTTFRKAGGLGPSAERPTNPNCKGIAKGKGKENPRVRWDASI